MPLAPHDAQLCAADVLRALGLPLLEVPQPVDARGAEAVRAHVARALDEVRPLASGPSLGAHLTTLRAAALRGGVDAGALRALAELRDLFGQAAFRRTKRAERARAFASLVLLFGLEAAIAGAPDPGPADLETKLRRVRSALRDR